MVILTWLPQMIDFDILCVMIMLGSPDIGSISYKNYFEQLITSKSILLKLSPDRAQLCMALQVLMEVQRYMH